MNPVERITTLLVDLQSTSDRKKETELITLVSQTDASLLDCGYIFNRLEVEGDYLDMIDMGEKYIDIFGVFIGSLSALSEHIRYTGVPNTKYVEPLPKARKQLIFTVFQILRTKFPTLIPNRDAFMSSCGYGLNDIVQSLLEMNRNLYFEDDNRTDLIEPQFDGLSRDVQVRYGNQNALYRAIDSKDQSTCMTLVHNGWTLDYRFRDEDMRIVTVRKYLQNLNTKFGRRIIKLYDDYIKSMDDMLVKGAVDE
jgi:hypothetical protein